MTATADVRTLRQAVVEVTAGQPLARAAGDAEEVLFVLDGGGTLTLGEDTYELAPESGAYVAPGEEYELAGAMRLVSVRISEPSNSDGAPGSDGTPGERSVVRRLGEQEAHTATAAREFRIVADPATGLRSATHFVGYIPTERAPDHFHTYDEVIYVLDGEGVLHTGSGRQPLGPGSQIELAARTVHCLENTGDRVMRVVAVFRPAGSPAAAYYPDGTPAHADAPVLEPAGP